MDEDAGAFQSQVGLRLVADLKPGLYESGGACLKSHTVKCETVKSQYGNNLCHSVILSERHLTELPRTVMPRGTPKSNYLTRITGANLRLVVAEKAEFKPVCVKKILLIWRREIRKWTYRNLPQIGWSDFCQ